MKKLIFRNIAILSAIFIVTLSIMLVTCREPQATQRLGC